MKNRTPGPLRVGIIGLGVGEQHIAGFNRSPGCVVRSVCDVSDEKIAMARAKYPTIKVTNNPDDILGDTEIDIVSVASFDEAHFVQIKKAFAHNKHVFVEKPVCRTLEEIAAVKEMWEKNRGRLKISSNLILRAAPLYKWLRREIELGTFGKIYSFDADYLYGRIEKITNGWRKNTPFYSVMLGGGIHMIDLMLWLTNERPVKIYGLGNKFCTKGTAFKPNDFSSATMRFRSSMVGRITANFGCVHRHHHAMRIFGTKRTFIYDDAGPRWHVTRDPSRVAEPISENPLPGAKGDLIPDFVASIVESRNTNKETQMMFDGLSIAGACDRSIKSKKEELIRYL